jgi:hypothetical protein
MATETAKQLLTPAQFVVARALAQAYGHLWSSAPDGMYDVDEIEAHYQKILDEREHFKFGITAPSLVCDPKDEAFGCVVHTTESGRLSWEIGPSGSVVLEVRRPSEVARFVQREIWQRFVHINPDVSRAIQQDPGVLVARIKIINDDTEKFVSSISAEKYDFFYEVSKYTESREADSEHLVCAEYNPDLHDDILFERHVYALIRPLVALMTIEQPRGEEEYYEDYRARVINPAIERAKVLLAPLFTRALPDPVRRWDDGNILDVDAETLPETYWSQLHPDAFTDDMALYIHHHGEEFPVESERVAVHAVLLLRNNPEMSLIEAVKTAICSQQYRPTE